MATSHVLTIQPIRLPARSGPWASAHHLLVAVRKCPQLLAPGHYQDEVALHHGRGLLKGREHLICLCTSPEGDSLCSVPPGLAQCPQVSVAHPCGPGWQPGAGPCSRPAGRRRFERLTDTGSPNMYVSVSENPYQSCPTPTSLYRHRSSAQSDMFRIIEQASCLCTTKATTRSILKACPPHTHTLLFLMIQGRFNKGWECSSVGRVVA